VSGWPNASARPRRNSTSRKGSQDACERRPETPVHIGTSGFLYEHWRGRFYPPSARGSELEWFAARFETVELNVTFYRMPASATFRSWAARVPPGFIFAVKASRYLTHILRLRQARQSVEYLLERVTELGEHLGPILLQLPPDLPIDLDGLAATLESFPPGIRVAVEPRHPSWYTDEFRALLIEHDAALCMADRRGPLMPAWRTADWAYLRFHGGRGRPASCYAEVALVAWAATIREILGTGSTAFVYFNNDHAGCALRDATVLGHHLQLEEVEIGFLPDVPHDVVERDGPVRPARPLPP
jgi:uncharacterized protein YecE (DUF72 family)